MAGFWAGPVAARPDLARQNRDERFTTIAERSSSKQRGSYAGFAAAIAKTAAPLAGPEYARHLAVHLRRSPKFAISSSKGDGKIRLIAKNPKRRTELVLATIDARYGPTRLLANLSAELERTVRHEAPVQLRTQPDPYEPGGAEWAVSGPSTGRLTDVITRVLLATP